MWQTQFSWASVCYIRHFKLLCRISVRRRGSSRSETFMCSSPVKVHIQVKFKITLKIFQPYFCGNNTVDRFLYSRKYWYNECTASLIVYLTSDDHLYGNAENKRQACLAMRTWQWRKSELIKLMASETQELYKNCKTFNFPIVYIISFFS